MKEEIDNYYLRSDDICLFNEFSLGFQFGAGILGKCIQKLHTLFNAQIIYYPSFWR
jgi:hypothetical protein